MFPAVPIIASPGSQYNPQGPLASSEITFVLWFTAALSISIFVIRIMRRYRQPQKSFRLEIILSFIPWFCATSYLLLSILRIEEVNSRVEIGQALLKNQILDALRPLDTALVASSLMLLLTLVVRAVLKRKTRQIETSG
jgi:hypothetical protein